MTAFATKGQIILSLTDVLRESYRAQLKTATARIGKISAEQLVNQEKTNHQLISKTKQSTWLNLGACGSTC